MDAKMSEMAMHMTGSVASQAATVREHASVRDQASGEFKNVVTAQVDHFQALRGEQHVIEETLMATHALILHQRDEAEIEQANLLEAERLRACHEQEHASLLSQQLAYAEERKERAATKKTHLKMVAALKAHQKTIHQLERAQQIAVAAREKQEYLRQSFQKKVQHRLDRQAREQKNLLESQKRVKMNVAALQKLENMNLDEEKRKEVEMEQKLGERHLLELQKKEAEQLRDVEQLQVKSLTTNFEFDLKCAWQDEVLEAAQVSAIIKLEAQQTKDLEECKGRAREARSSLKASQLKSMQELQSRQLKKKQARAAASLARSQARRAAARRRAFEVGQETHMFDVMIGANSSQSVSQSSGTRSSRYGRESISRVDERSGSERSSGRDTSSDGDIQECDDEDNAEAEQLRKVDQENRDIAERVNREDSKSLEALCLKMDQEVEDLREAQQKALSKLQQEHKAEKAAMMEQWRITAAQLKDKDEAEFKALKLQHAQEKDQLIQSHTSERESILRTFHLDRQMEKMRQEDAGNRAKGEFLQYVCHELRNPLTAVFGLCNFMLSDETELSAGNVELLLSQARVMNCIVDDVLDLNKVQEGKLTFEQVPFHLTKLLTTIVDEMRMFRVASDKHVKVLLEVAPDVPEFAKSDPSRIRQVASNLLSNAVKFCPADGVATLKVRLLPPGPPGADPEAENSFSLQFEVTDNGIGIKDEDIPNLFKPFSQLKASHHREYGGSGLGLSICKGLVECMGGEIGARPLPQGACFWFSITFGVVSPGEQQDLVQSRSYQ